MSFLKNLSALLVKDKYHPPRHIRCFLFNITKDIWCKEFEDITPNWYLLPFTKTEKEYLFKYELLKALSEHKDERIKFIMWLIRKGNDDIKLDEMSLYRRLFVTKNKDVLQHINDCLKCN